MPFNHLSSAFVLAELTDDTSAAACPPTEEADAAARIANLEAAMEGP